MLSNVALPLLSPRSGRGHEGGLISGMQPCFTRFIILLEQVAVSNPRSQIRPSQLVNEGGIRQPLGLSLAQDCVLLALSALLIVEGIKRYERLTSAAVHLRPALEAGLCLGLVVPDLVAFASELMVVISQMKI